MIEYEGNAALAPRVRSQNGGGAYVHSSTLTVANGSSIDGNTAGSVIDGNVVGVGGVSSPACALASGLVVGSKSNQTKFDRCERETPQ